jgi:hypothetical protein
MNANYLNTLANIALGKKDNCVECKENCGNMNHFQGSDKLNKTIHRKVNNCKLQKASIILSIMLYELQKLLCYCG